MRFIQVIPHTLLERILKIVNLKNLFNSQATNIEILNSIVFNRYITCQNYTMSNYGVWMLNNYNDKTFKLSLMGYRSGLEKIILSLKHPFTFVDIGANQGVFSLVAAKNKYCSYLHTFEPNLSINKLLEKNLEKNDVKNVTIHKAAIGSHIGTHGFFVPDNHSGAGRISSNLSNMEINCVNRFYLDKLLIDVDTLFIKIDVEGNEDEVLQELFNSKVKDKVKYIFIEICSKYNFNEEYTIKILNTNGFNEVFRKENKISYDALFVKK
jgi:FkbM family methyltransferase